MELVVGTESTWSLRVWICLTLANIKATDVVIDLQDENYKAKILTHSPTGLVPAFIDGHIIIHDSLAITEYLNECAGGRLYPDSVKQRALARSLCAEMHAGFMHLRQHCPFTLKPAAAVVLTDELTQEINRIETIFEAAMLPYMFELPGAVDAFYAILAFRLNSYGIELTGNAGRYQRSLLKWDRLQQAIEQAHSWAKSPH